MPLPLPRSTLNRQARRLVQRNHMFVAVDDTSADHLGFGIRDRCPFRWRRCLAFGQRRNSDLLADLDPGRAFYAATIHTDFSLAAHLFDAALRYLREDLLEPAVQPLIPVTLCYGKCLNTAHANTPLAIHSPNISPPRLSATDKAT